MESLAGVNRCVGRISPGKDLSHNTSLMFENILTGDPITKHMDEFLEYDTQGCPPAYTHAYTCVLTHTQACACVCIKSNESSILYSRASVHLLLMCYAS